MDEAGSAAPSCCHGASACVFTKALLARSAHCGLALRQSVGEGDAVVCTSPVAQMNCTTLVGLMRERAVFVLRVPRPPAPLVHAKALQLQCGGLDGLRRAVQADATDVHALVGLAQRQHGSLMDLPWARIVEAIAAWQPRRRRAGPAA